MFQILRNEVIVFEETEAMGGISKTVNHNGNRMDMGAHRFFSKQKWITPLRAVPPSPVRFRLDGAPKGFRYNFQKTWYRAFCQNG